VTPSRLDRALAGTGPGRTREALRVLGLPRRSAVAPAVAGANAPCDLPGCRWRGLNAMQTWAEQELADRRGLLVLAGVGHGKWLVAARVAKVLGLRRVVTIVPNRGLRAQSLAEWRHFRRHIELPEHVDATDPYDAEAPTARCYVVAASDLSSKRYADLLECIEPEALAIDEAHLFKDPKSARTRRLARFLRERPGLPLVLMSGTISSRSLRDFGHLAEWALRAGSPLPAYSFAWRELEAWADVVDAPAGAVPVEGEGVLAALAEGDEPIAAAFGRRLVETPGVVSMPRRSCEASIYVERTPYEPPAEIRKAIALAQKTWQIGENYIDSAALMAFYCRALTVGVEYWWDWANGHDREWLEARRGWEQAIREALRRSRAGFDSPLLVAEAAERGDFQHPAWDAWAAVKDRPRPTPRSQVFSDHYAEAVIADVGYEEPTLIFAELPALGAHIADLSGWPWFGGGDDAAEALIALASGPNAGTETIVLSGKAHGTGRNLQAWSRLALAGSASGAAWEQRLGRAHRQGQLADAVTALAIGAGGALAGDFELALAQARRIRDVTQAPQLLLDATLI